MRARLLAAAPLATGACLAALACAAPDEGRRGAAGDTADAIAVALVDSLPWANELTEGTLHRVEVRGPAGTDTIPGVLTAVRPVVLEDSLVTGLRQQDDRTLGGFVYHPRTRRLEPRPLPEDLFAWGRPCIAPDGRHLVYFAMDEAGGAYGVLLAWPSGEVRHRGPTVTPLPTDGGVDDAAWDSARAWTQTIAIAEPIGAHLRTRGTIGADGSVSTLVDTTVPGPGPDPRDCAP